MHKINAVVGFYILKQIADLYEVTVNDLIETRSSKPKLFNRKKNKILICIESIILAWLVATIVYSILKIIFPNKTLCGH